MCSRGAQSPCRGALCPPNHTIFRGESRFTVPPSACPWKKIGARGESPRPYLSHPFTNRLAPIRHESGAINQKANRRPAYHPSSRASSRSTEGFLKVLLTKRVVPIRAWPAPAIIVRPKVSSFYAHKHKLEESSFVFLVHDAL